MQMSPQTNAIPCRKVSAGCATGELLISKDDICFFLSDPETGRLIEEDHDIDGKNLAGKVLVFPSGKGSAVVQDEGLFALKQKGNAPAALIVQHPDTVLVFGALITAIPVVALTDLSDLEALKSGIRVTVDADQGQVFVQE